MRLVGAERNRSGNLGWEVIDLDVDAGLAQRRHHSIVKLSDRSRLQSNLLVVTAARRDLEQVFGEIELDFE